MGICYFSEIFCQNRLPGDDKFGKKLSRVQYIYRISVLVCLVLCVQIHSHGEADARPLPDPPPQPSFKYLTMNARSLR